MGVIKSFKLFEQSYQERIDAEQEEINKFKYGSVGVWVKETYDKFKKIESEISSKMISVDGSDVYLANNQQDLLKLGLGHNYTKLSNLIDKYKTSEGLTSYLEKANDEINNIRKSLEGRWDYISGKNGKRATSDEYSKVNRIRKLMEDFEEPWSIYRELKRVDLDIYHDITWMVSDLADDLDMDSGISHLELWRGLDIQLILFKKGMEPYIEWRVANHQQTTKGSIGFRKVGSQYGGQSISITDDEFNKVYSNESRFKEYFDSVTIRYANNKNCIYIDLCNQKKVTS